MEKVDLSVISLTWNSEKYLNKFIESLHESLKESGLKYEIFIIDNGSKDKTKEIIKEYSETIPNLCIIPLGKNMGTTFSRNVGIRMAKGEYVAILDSDTIIPKNFFVSILKAFEEIPSKKIGIIAPKIIYPDGTFQESARKFPTLSTKIFRLFDFEKLRSENESIIDSSNPRIVPVDYAISAAWVLKKEIFDKVGLLNENIFYAPEDVEFCARLWSNEYEVWYYPKAEVIHNCQRLTKKKPFSKLGFLHTRDLIKFWTKFNVKLLRKKVEDKRMSFLNS